MALRGILEASIEKENLKGSVQSNGVGFVLLNVEVNLPSWRIPVDVCPAGQWSALRGVLSVWMEAEASIEKENLKGNVQQNDGHVSACKRRSKYFYLKFQNIIQKHEILPDAFSGNIKNRLHPANKKT